MLSNSLRMIKIDGNMLRLWQIVCKNIIWTLVHLLVLSYELFVYARTWITLRWVNWWWAPGYTTGFLEPTAKLNITRLIPTICYITYSPMSSFASLITECCKSTAMASHTDSTICHFKFSHFFCFVISFKNDQERTPFSYFIICRTASMFSVTLLPLLAFH